MIVVLVADVTLHACPPMLTWAFAAVMEPAAAKFWPVKVSVCGPVIDDGLTEFRAGVAACAHVYVQGPDEHNAELEPTKIVIGIAWPM